VGGFEGVGDFGVMDLVSDCFVVGCVDHFFVVYV